MTAVLDRTTLTGFYEGYFVTSAQDYGIYLLTSSGVIPLFISELDELDDDLVSYIGRDWLTLDGTEVKLATPNNPIATGNNTFEGALAGSYHGETDQMFIDYGVGFSGASASGDFTPLALSTLRKLLVNNDRDVNALVLTDSTGDGSTEWPHLITEDLADGFATHSTNFLAWVSTDYGTPEVISTGSGAYALNVNNCAISGSTLDNVMGALFPAAIGNLNPDIIIISHGQNYTGLTNHVLRGRFVGAIEQIMLAHPGVPVVMVLQNPRQTDTLMDQIVDQITEYAQDRGDIELIDVHSLFILEGKDASLYADSVHPSAAGQALYRQAWNTKFNAAPLATRTIDPAWTDTPGTNLLANGYFAAFDGAVPDSWTKGGNGTLSKETTIVYPGSPHSVKFENGSSATSISQTVNAIPYRGMEVTLRVRERIDTAGNLNSGRVRLFDNGSGSPLVASNPGAVGLGGFREIVISGYTVPMDATLIGAYVYANSSGTTAGTIYIDEVVLNTGDIPVGLERPVALPANWRGVTNFDAADQAEYDTWAGADADFLSLTTGHSSWSAFDNNIDSYLADFAADTRPIVWFIPLSVDGTSLATVAAGTYDAKFTAIAEKMLAAAADDNSAIIVRLGWEADLQSTWAWSAFGVETDYINAWRKVHGLMRAVSPRFKFDWTTNWVTVPGDYNPETIYPGDAYVDIIGRNIYYRAEFGDGPTNPPTNPDPVGVFTYQKETLTYGLDWLASFALAHGKPISIPEYGVNWEKPQWIELLAQWIAAQPAVVYHAYFDNNVDSNYQCRISDGSKGLAGHAYLMNFGTSVPTYGAAALSGATAGVIGAGGSLPTAWGSTLSDVTVEVLGTETVDGVACLNVRITADVSSGYAQFYAPAAWGVTTPVAQNEVWRQSFACEVEAETGNGITTNGLTPEIYEVDSGYDYLDQGGSGSDPYTYSTLPLYAQHYTHTRKLANAGVVRLTGSISVYMGDTPASVDLLIAAPVLSESL